jgi:hypothetical protein
VEKIELLKENSTRAGKVVHSMEWIGMYTVITTLTPFVVRILIIRIVV